MNKATLTIEMNPLFEFYAVVTAEGVPIYSGVPYEKAAHARCDGEIWLDDHGYELDQPDKQPDKSSEIIAEMERTLDKMRELVRSL